MKKSYSALVVAAIGLGVLCLVGISSLQAKITRPDGKISDITLGKPCYAVSTTDEETIVVRNLQDFIEDAKNGTLDSDETGYTYDGFGNLTIGPCAGLLKD